MIIQLPTFTNLARYSFESELDNAKFKFSFGWSERAGHWLMNIADASNTVLISGRRVVVGIPLLSRFRDIRLPKGILLAHDTSGNDVEPGFADLGTRVKLLYFSSDDPNITGLLADVG
jgi:hypothetical protein